MQYYNVIGKVEDCSLEEKAERRTDLVLSISVVQKLRFGALVVILGVLRPERIVVGEERVRRVAKRVRVVVEREVAEERVAVHERRFGRKAKQVLVLFVRQAKRLVFAVFGADDDALQLALDVRMSKVRDRDRRDAAALLLVNGPSAANRRFRVHGDRVRGPGHGERQLVAALREQKRTGPS